MTAARQALTIGGFSLLTVGLTYCLYFDYKRRNDPIFRKKLLKEQRRVAKQKQNQGANVSREAEQMLAAAVAAVNAEAFPETHTGKENYFMEQIGMGEMLAARLPQGTIPAAIAFFKAYKVYPSPQELMLIYQRTMPPEVFAIVVEMIKLDVNQAINSSKPLSSSKASLISPDGPLIEEITGEERALLDALKSGTSPPKPSSSAQSTPTEIKQPSSTSETETTPKSAPTEPLDQSVTEIPSTLVPGKEDGVPSTPLSETGSQTAGSQTGNSFVLVDEDAPATIVPPKIITKTVTDDDVVGVHSTQDLSDAQIEIPKMGLEEVASTDQIYVPVETAVVDGAITDTGGEN